MRISDWSSDVCSSDLGSRHRRQRGRGRIGGARADEGFGRRFERDVETQPFAVERIARIRQGARRDARPDRRIFGIEIDRGDRKSIVEGKRVEVRVALGGSRLPKKKKKKNRNNS